nr:mechanosensitive ion channel domain-containing protein [uncultured Carboxylicivirga sp.]
MRACLISLSLLLSSVGSAQVNLFGKDSIDTEVGYFSTVSIGSETEKTQALIRNVNSQLDGYQQKDEIDSLTLKRLKTVASYRKSVSKESLNNIDYRQADDLRVKLSGLKSQLDEARKQLASISTQLNLNRNEVQGLIDKWEKTLQNQNRQVTPDRVIERIKSNITDLEKLNSEINKQNTIALTRQDEITSAILFLDEVVTNVNAVLERFRTQIYSTDSPPLWSVFTNKSDTVSLKNRMVRSFELRKLSVVSHKNVLIHTLIIYVIIFILIFSFFVFIRKKLRTQDELMECSSIKLPLIFISKSISSSFLFASLFVFIFIPDLQPEVKDLIRLLLIIPLLRILPYVWPQLPIRFFYWSTGIFLLLILTDLSSNLPLLSRLVVLVNGILAAFTFVSLWSWLRKNKKDSHDELKLFSLKVLFIGMLSVILSVLINAIGNSYLSIVLFNGAIMLVFGGLLIFSSVEVIKSLFELVVQHRLLVDLHIFRTYPEEILKWLSKIITYSAIIYWIVISAKSYLIYSPVYDWVASVLTRKLELGSVSISLGNIVAFVITISITLYISKFIRFVLEDEVYTHFEMPRGIGGAISMLVRLLLLGFGFILAFGAADIDISNITIIFGALGVGIGFGLQNIFNNLVSGLILAFERPIQVGDVLQISSLDLMGEVKEIGIRASVIRTFDGAEVIVPNGNLISNEMVNWTLSDRRRRQEIAVGVSYGTDLKMVLDILDKVVSEQKGVMKNPKPFIVFKGFGDSSLDFRVMFWTHFDDGLAVKSDVGVAIDNAFKEANITIPFPQRDLHIYPVNKESDQNN